MRISTLRSLANLSTKHISNRRSQPTGPLSSTITPERFVSPPTEVGYQSLKEDYLLQVVYMIEGFVEKNKDELSPDVLTLLEVNGGFYIVILLGASSSVMTFIVAPSPS